MVWTDTTDPSSTWSDDTDVTEASLRHTYGHEYGKTTRIRYGDHVKYGGLCFARISDPTDTQTDVADPTDSWSDVSDPSSTWSDA